MKPLTRPVLWAVLLAPALWLLARWATGSLAYGEVVTRSGAWSAVLLIPAAAVTPLRRAVPRARWLPWLAEHRGDLGAAALGYALLHAGAHAVGRDSPRLLLREALDPWMLAGWAALLLFLLFAATTEDRAARLLRHSWRALHRLPRAHATLDLVHRGLKRWHRLVYLGSALALAHWLMAAYDPLIERVQAGLHLYGTYYGPVDGIIGPQSRLALQQFQAQHGLEVTGTVTPEVLDRLGIVPN